MSFIKSKWYLMNLCYINIFLFSLDLIKLSKNNEFFVNKLGASLG